MTAMESIKLDKFVLILRMTALFVGTTSLVLTAYSFSDDTNEEEFLLPFTLIALLVTGSFLFLYHFTDILKDSLHGKYLDVGLHLISGFLLIPTGAFMLLVAAEHSNFEKPGLTVTRALAGLISVENGVVYLLTAVLTLRTVPYAPSKHGEGLEWEDPLVETNEAKKDTDTFGYDASMLPV